MEISTYIIWEVIPHDRIRGHSEVRGLFTGTFLEADALLERMGESFYRTEPPVMTADNVHEWLSP